MASLVAGVYGGTGVFLLLHDLDLPARRDQAIYAGSATVAGLLVTAAAVFLERVCRLPDDGEDGPAAAAR